MGKNSLEQWENMMSALGKKERKKENRARME